MAVRPYGRVVLTGGVGMAGGGLDLPYSVDDAELHHGAWAMDVSTACCGKR